MKLAPKKILLVHNDPEERGRLAIMLSRFGHEVKFSSGRGCPDEMSRSNDLVIVDDMLSEQRGLDFITQISNKEREKVIYLSSSPSMEAENLNIYEWILKPFESLKLAVVVCDYFVESFTEQALPNV